MEIIIGATACSSNDFCLASKAHTTCHEGVCQCETGLTLHDDKCVAAGMVTLCDAAADPDAMCADAMPNSKCTGGTCSCEAGYAHDLSEKTCILVDLGVTGCFDGAGSGDSFCQVADVNAVCEESKCTCMAGYAMDSTTNTCIEITLGGSPCSHAQDPDGYCSSAYDNAVCTDGVCACADSYSSSMNNERCEETCVSPGQAIVLSEGIYSDELVAALTSFDAHFSAGQTYQSFFDYFAVYVIKQRMDKHACLAGQVADNLADFHRGDAIDASVALLQETQLPSANEGLFSDSKTVISALGSVLSQTLSGYLSRASDLDTLSAGLSQAVGSHPDDSLAVLSTVQSDPIASRQPGYMAALHQAASEQPTTPGHVVDIALRMTSSARTKSSVLTLISTAFTEQTLFANIITSLSLSGISQLLSLSTAGRELDVKITDSTAMLTALQDVIVLINTDPTTVHTELTNLINDTKALKASSKEQMQYLSNLKDESIKLFDLVSAMAVENSVDVDPILPRFLEESFPYSFKIMYRFLIDMTSSPPQDLLSLLTALRVYHQAILASERALINQEIEFNSKLSIFNTALNVITDDSITTTDDMVLKVLSLSLNKIHTSTLHVSNELPVWGVVLSVLSSAKSQWQQDNQIISTVSSIIQQTRTTINNMDKSKASLTATLDAHVTVLDVWLAKINDETDGGSDFNTISQADIVVTTLVEALESSVTRNVIPGLTSLFADIVREMDKSVTDAPTDGMAIAQLLLNELEISSEKLVDDLNSSKHTVKICLEMSDLIQKIDDGKEISIESMQSMSFTTDVMNDFKDYLLASVTDTETFSSYVESNSRMLHKLLHQHLQKEISLLSNQYDYVERLGDMTAAASEAQKSTPADPHGIAEKAIAKLNLAEETHNTQTEQVKQAVVALIKDLNAEVGHLIKVAPQHPDIAAREMKSIESKIKAIANTQQIMLENALQYSLEASSLVHTAVTSASTTPSDPQTVLNAISSLPSSTSFPMLETAVETIAVFQPDLAAFSAKTAVDLLEPLSKIIDQMYYASEAHSQVSSISSKLLEEVLATERELTVDIGNVLSSISLDLLDGIQSATVDMVPAVDVLHQSSSYIQARRTLEEKVVNAESELTVTETLITEVTAVNNALSTVLSDVMTLFAADSTDAATLADVISSSLSSHTQSLVIAAVADSQHIASNHPTDAQLIVDTLTQYFVTSEADLLEIMAHKTSIEQTINHLTLSLNSLKTMSTKPYLEIKHHVLNSIVQSIETIDNSADDVSVSSSITTPVQNLICGSSVGLNDVAIASTLKDMKHSIAASYESHVKDLEADLSVLALNIREAVLQDPAVITALQEIHASDPVTWNHFQLPDVSFDVKHSPHEHAAFVAEYAAVAAEHTKEIVMHIAAVSGEKALEKGVLEIMKEELSDVVGINNPMLHAYSVSRVLSTHITDNGCVLEPLPEMFDALVTQVHQAALIHDVHEHLHELAYNRVPSCAAIACNNDAFCAGAVANSVCKNGLCTCAETAGYYPDAGQTQCIFVEYEYIGCDAGVTSDLMCHTGAPYSKCMSDVCECPDGYSFYQGLCVEVLIGITQCDVDTVCNRVIPASLCTADVCSCQEGFVHDESRKSCIQISLGTTPCYGISCSHVIQNAACLEGIHQCQAGYAVSEVAEQCDEILLDVTQCGQATNPDEFCGGIRGAVCKVDVCTCADGFAKISENSCEAVAIGDTDCEGKAADFCPSAVANSECVDGVCRCADGHGRGVLGNSCEEVTLIHNAEIPVIHKTQLFPAITQMQQINENNDDYQDNDTVV